MSNLEDLIRDICKRGELTHLSLVPRVVKDADDKPLYKGWGATFAPASSQTNTFAEDRDPVIALTTALEEARLRRRTSSPDGTEAPKKPVKKAPTTLADIGL